MEFKFDNDNRIIIAKVLEEIDHHTCAYISRKTDFEISRYRPKKLVFDLEGVNFMDSSGIGLILGRYRSTIRNNGQVYLINVSPSIKKIFQMSGIFKIISLCENIDDVLERV